MCPVPVERTLQLFADLPRLDVGIDLCCRMQRPPDAFQPKWSRTGGISLIPDRDQASRPFLLNVACRIELIGLPKGCVQDIDIGINDPNQALVSLFGQPDTRGGVDGTNERHRSRTVDMAILRTQFDRDNPFIIIESLDSGLRRFGGDNSSDPRNHFQPLETLQRRMGISQTN